MPLEIDWNHVSEGLGIGVSNETPDVEKVETPSSEETEQETVSEEPEVVEEESPAAEAEAETPEAEPETPATEEEEDTAPDDTPEWALTRIGKLTARNTEAKKAAEEAKAQLEEYKAKYEAVVAVTPEASIDDDLAQVEQIRAWALDNLDGGTITKPDGSEEFIDSRKVREYLKKADDRVVELKMKAKEVESSAKAFETEARQAYPEIFDGSKPASQAVATFLTQNPQAKRIPNIHLVLGDALLGQAVRTGALKIATGEPAKTEAAKAKPKVAPSVPSPQKPTKLPASKAPARKLTAEIVESKDGMTDYILQNILN